MEGNFKYYWLFAVSTVLVLRYDVISMFYKNDMGLESDLMKSMSAEEKANAKVYIKKMEEKCSNFQNGLGEYA
jgi:hypothetical protein